MEGEGEKERTEDEGDDDDETGGEGKLQVESRAQKKKAILPPTPLTAAIVIGHRSVTNSAPLPLR